MLPDADYDCGCKVRGGIDPVDGLETSRLYPCRLGPKCPNAALFLRTVEALAREDPDTKISRFTMNDALQAPERWKPLVRPVTDEAPEDPDEPPPDEIDVTLDCGCRFVGTSQDGKRTAVFYACPKNMECPNALQYVCHVKSLGEEPKMLHPEETVQ